MPQALVFFSVLAVWILALPVIIQFYIRWKCKGRMLCGILGRGRGLDFRLLKEKDEFVREGSDTWVVDPDQIKLVYYPLLWPPVLAMFQQIVPFSIYMRGRAEPLDWEAPALGLMSSKELTAVLDPHWMVALVKGVEEGMKINRLEKMLPLLGVALGAISLVFLFVLVTKLNVMEQMLKLVR